MRHGHFLNPTRAIISRQGPSLFYKFITELLDPTHLDPHLETIRLSQIIFYVLRVMYHVMVIYIWPETLYYWEDDALITKPVMVIWAPVSQLLGGAAVSSHCHQMGVDCSST